MSKNSIFYCETRVCQQSLGWDILGEDDQVVLAKVWLPDRFKSGQKIRVIVEPIEGD